jgi:hypothetical protein
MKSQTLEGFGREKGSDCNWGLRSREEEPEIGGL